MVFSLIINAERTMSIMICYHMMLNFCLNNLALLSASHVLNMLLLEFRFMGQILSKRRHLWGSISVSTLKRGLLCEFGIC